MDWLSQFAQNSEIPIITAIVLGLLTAISPCPLVTNITATAYISKGLTSKRMVLLNGFLYTLGRAFSYSLIGVVLFWGASKFHVARFFQSNGEIVLAPILIFVGLMMLGVIKLNFLSKGNLTEKVSERFKNKGWLGAFVLGVLFALAFCPYSGALYFGILIPMTIASPEGLYLPIIFAIGTGLPVMLFAYLIAFSASKIGVAFNRIKKVEWVMRHVTGGVFVLAGIYYALIFLKVL